MFVTVELVRRVPHGVARAAATAVLERRGRGRASGRPRGSLVSPSLYGAAEPAGQALVQHDQTVEREARRRCGNVGVARSEPAAQVAAMYDVEGAASRPGRSAVFASLAAAVSVPSS